MTFWQLPKCWRKPSTLTRVSQRETLKVQWSNPRFWSAESNFSISLLQSIKCLTLLLYRTKREAAVYLKGAEETWPIILDNSQSLSYTTLFIHLRDLKRLGASQDSIIIQADIMILKPYIKILCTAAPRNFALNLLLQAIQRAQAGSNPLGRQTHVISLHMETALHRMRAMDLIKISLITYVYLKDAATRRSINLFQMTQMGYATGMGTGTFLLSTGRPVMIPCSKAFKQTNSSLTSLLLHHVDPVWRVWIKFSTPCLFHKGMKSVLVLNLEQHCQWWGKTSANVELSNKDDIRLRSYSSTFTFIISDFLYRMNQFYHIFAEEVSSFFFDNTGQALDCTGLPGRFS